MTNREQLKLIRAKYNLTNREISKLLGKSYHCVLSWTRTPLDKSARNMPDKQLVRLNEKTQHLEAITDRR